MATIPFPDLLGCGYLPLSRKAECQKSINVYRERVESDEGVGQFSLYKSPGLSVDQGLGVVQIAQVRGFYELNDHLFAIVGDTVIDYTPSFIQTTYGTISNIAPIAKMAASMETLMIVVDGHMYRINSGVLTEIFPPFTPRGIAFVKNYFVSLADDLTAQFYWSADDGATWNGADVQTAEADANKLLEVKAINQQICIIGNRISQWFSIGSNPDAPFVPNDSGVMRTGTAATDSVGTLGESLLFISRDKEGQNRVAIVRGYSFDRISDHALENTLRGYAADFGIDDAIGMTYEMNGHQFYRLTFPSADATWEYNLTVSQATGKAEWYQVAWWDMVLGQYHRHRANCIVSAFGKLYAGDWENGVISELSPDVYHDYGFPMRWERQCPHILQDNKKVSYDRLELGAETGVGLADPLYLNDYSMDYATFHAAVLVQVGLGNISAAQALILENIYLVHPYATNVALPDFSILQPLGFYPWGTVQSLNGVVYGSQPMIRMKYSDDGAKSFHSELSRSLGAYGDDVIVAWDRLGAGRDRVYNLSGDFPCKLAMTTSWVDAEALMS